ncbi:MAG: beta-ketoacyl-[acyl-carrier-protein] synthase family protein [Deltaproteobacteria bacterium]|nr:beta-ketoacyl-[acyl-carrier-protein] synthase family protein [Deltaproteobacteria bacterium]
MSFSQSKRRVAVTGFGMITPLGLNTEETFSLAEKGASGIDTIRSFNAEGLPCRIAGEVKKKVIDPPEGLRRRWPAKFSSRAAKLMAVAADEAARMAGLEQITDRTRIGVSLGSFGERPSIADILSHQRYCNSPGEWDLKGMSRQGGYDYLRFYRRKPDIATSLVARAFDCRGPNLTLTSACAAGAQAIGEAFRAIRTGQCDVMIAGGCEAIISLIGLAGFILLKALSERHASPPKASRPFDRRRNGFVLSEGAGAVVLEAMDHARNRGAPVSGELLGYGVSADAYRITDTQPEGKGAALAMEGALADAALAPESIEYINAHGTSTPRNDVTETMAVKAVFGKRAYDIPISSNKSMLGHSIAASGAIEFILTLVGMNRSTILPTINYEFSDPDCDLWYVPNTAIEQRHGIALSNSFGFGGQNACLCLAGVP